MRIPTLICALAIAAPGALPGQAGKWTGTLAAGYGQGVGDAFGGKGAVSAHVASLRLRGGGGAWRPFAATGIGAYLVRVHDQIVTQDATGTPIPGLQFDDSSSEVKPGMSLLAGLERARVFGRAGLGVQARWDGVLSGTLANVLSVGVVVTLD